MENNEIIGLYFARDEQAIRETDRKYGALCRNLALQILNIFQDAEECVADSYHRVWNSIPPQRPLNFRAFLAKIVRNQSISRWRRNRAEKRGGGPTEELLSELGECLHASSGDPVSAAEMRELTRSIDAWLSRQSNMDRYLFLRRYWYGDAVKDIQRAIGHRGCAQRLHRLRLSLGAWLEKEGFSV